MDTQPEDTFAELHSHTAELTSTNSFRLVTYNILADLYAFRDFEEYRPYCSSEHLELSHRQNVVIKEITGYNGDILCLQEVDERSFQGNLTKTLNIQGFNGIYLKKIGKRGELTEGTAVFYRNSKFKLLAEHKQSIVDILENEPSCQDIKEWAYKNTSWKQYIEVQPHTVQIAVLEWTEHPNKVLIVCNTHLLWDQDCPYVRVAQVLASIRLIEQFVQRYKEKDPRVIYCGDFNSEPVDHVLRYILQNDPKCNLPEPRPYSAEDPSMTDITKAGFSHSLRLGNACGIRPYTCLTSVCRYHLDYIFYDLDLLTVTKVIPQLNDSIATRHTALPNVEIPSDHLPQICEFSFKV